MNQTYKTNAVPQNDFDREELRKIAKSQRVVLFFILMFVPMILMMFALAVSEWPFSLVLIAFLLIIAYIIYSYVNIISLANMVSGVGMAVVCGLLFLIFAPFGYILLFFINFLATGILKKAGYKVGLLGVNPNAFKSSESSCDLGGPPPIPDHFE